MISGNPTVNSFFFSSLDSPITLSPPQVPIFRQRYALRRHPDSFTEMSSALTPSSVEPSVLSSLSTTTHAPAWITQLESVLDLATTPIARRDGILTSLGGLDFVRGLSVCCAVLSSPFMAGCHAFSSSSPVPVPYLPSFLCPLNAAP